MQTSDLEKQIANAQRAIEQTIESERFFHSLCITARETSVLFIQYLQWMHDDAKLTVQNIEVSRHLPPWHYFAGETGQLYKTAHFGRLSSNLKAFARDVNPRRITGHNIDKVLGSSSSMIRTPDYLLINAVRRGQFGQALTELKLYFESIENNSLLRYFRRYRDGTMKQVQLGWLGHSESTFQYYLRGTGVYYTVPLLIVVAVKFGWFDQLFAFLDDVMAIPTVRDFIAFEMGPHPIDYHNLANLWALILKIDGTSEAAKLKQEARQINLGSWERTCLNFLQNSQPLGLTTFQERSVTPIERECHLWWNQQNPMVKFDGKDIQLLVGLVADLSVS
ncbi:hypothetical protein H4R35_002769 [Dimargaris xerosporica]|nr:hypothetical protein H4R35_002769 [Dimargaris xerosporica]